MKSAKFIILDTNAWIFHYGLGPQTVVNTVRAIVSSLRKDNYTPAYTSITRYEIKNSPRKEIASIKNDILDYLESVGLELKHEYDHWKLLELAKKLEKMFQINKKYRNDLAIIIAAFITDSILLSCDKKAVQLALTIFSNPHISRALQDELGAKTAELRVIYVDPTLK